MKLKHIVETAQELGLFVSTDEKFGGKFVKDAPANWNEQDIWNEFKKYLKTKDIKTIPGENSSRVVDALADVSSMFYTKNTKNPHHQKAIDRTFKNKSSKNQQLLPPFLMN